VTRDSPDPWNAQTDPSWYECEGVIKALEDAWRRSEAPAVADYLPTSGPGRRFYGLWLPESGMTSDTESRG
jgi:hypothetical protein